MKKSENFEIIELGSNYLLPKYQVIDGKGIQQTGLNQAITFVRGDKTDNGVTIPRQMGILHEQLLGMMITDLEYKNQLVHSYQTEAVIFHIRTALTLLEQRQTDRQQRNVDGTYKE